MIMLRDATSNARQSTAGTNKMLLLHRMKNNVRTTIVDMRHLFFVLKKNYSGKRHLNTDTSFFFCSENFNTKATYRGRMED